MMLQSLHLIHSEKRFQGVQVPHTKECPDAWLNPRCHLIQDVFHVESCVHLYSKETERTVASVPRMRDEHVFFLTIEFHLVPNSPPAAVLLEHCEILENLIIFVLSTGQKFVS